MSVLTKLSWIRNFGPEAWLGIRRSVVIDGARDDAKTRRKMEAARKTEITLVQAWLAPRGGAYELARLPR